MTGCNSNSPIQLGFFALKEEAGIPIPGTQGDLNLGPSHCKVPTTAPPFSTVTEYITLKENFLRRWKRNRGSGYHGGPSKIITLSQVDQCAVGSRDLWMNTA